VRIKIAGSDALARALAAGELERRTIPAKNVRAISEEGSPDKIVGHFVVFNEWTEICPDFREMVNPAAVDRTMAEDDILSFFNHNPDLLLGRNTSGTLVLAKDDIGVYSEVAPPAEAYYTPGLLASAKRGDVPGGSFWFMVNEERWGKDGRVELRELLDVTMFEQGPVSMPAYPTTDVAVREFLPGISPDRLERALLRARSGQALQEDLDLIVRSADALRRHLPPDPVDRDGAPQDPAPGGPEPLWRLRLLRKRIDLLDL